MSGPGPTGALPPEDSTSSKKPASNISNSDLDGDEGPHVLRARKLKAYGCSRRRFFTDAEDDEILQRVFHLQTKKVISSVSDLCAELNQQENRKNVRRLIGLYLCASLPNRLAYYCTERLLHLVSKMTPAKVTPTKQRKTSGGGRMTWTAAEDILLSESVLFDSRSKR